MPKSPSFQLAAAVALVASLSACGGDSTAPSSAESTDAQIAADIATASGEAVAADVADLAAGESLTGSSGSVASPDGLSLAVGSNPNACPHDPATNRHVCARSTAGNVSVTRSYQFLDADGNVMASYDPQLTASIDFLFQIDGTRTGKNHTASFHRERHSVVSGLAGSETERTWNGTGGAADTSAHTAPRGTRQYAMSATETTTNLVMKLPRAENPYPASGTIVRDVQATVVRDGANAVTKQLSRRVEVTFDGTKTARLTVGTLACSLDLDTREVSCAP